MYRIPVVRVALVRESTVRSEMRTIRGPDDAAAILGEMIGDYDREAFAVLFVDAKHHVIGAQIASVGTLDSAQTGPREIFRAAILAGAKAVILGHNHPSGDPAPSNADLHFTTRLVKSGELLGIAVLDHIVLGEHRHVSLREHGVIHGGSRSGD